jgi:hypothetical protein
MQVRGVEMGTNESRIPSIRLAVSVVALLLLAGCTAARVTAIPDAPKVRVGTQPPAGSAEQLGAITAKHGGGCGLYGTRGDYEGAHTLLRNKAAQLGADYVQVIRVTEPRLEGICMNQAYTIDGLAYRLAAQEPVAGVATQPAQPAAARQI